MRAFKELADRMVEVFKNTRTADVMMYIASVVESFFTK